MNKTDDILIVGGGIMGASISYHLANDGFDGSIIVFEKDPVYTYSSTALCAAGVRSQFTNEISIKMAIYDIGVFERFEEEMAVDGEAPHIEFRQIGQMIAADEQELPSLKKHTNLQKSLGAKVDHLSPEEIKEVYPEVNIEKVAGGSICRRGGKLDAYGLLQGYIKKGKSLGVRYVSEEVTNIFNDRNRVAGVETAKGNRFAAPIVVIAAGPWSAEVGKLVGIDLPIKPLRRMIHMVKPQKPFDPCRPKIFLGAGPSVTPETGGSLLVTRRKNDDTYGFDFSVDYHFFNDVVWPEIAERIPVLDTLKLVREWSGLYSVCLHDSNDILGKHPEVEGLYLAVGFSGHGMQQSPAVGRGLSELIRLGRYETLDLRPFRFERFEENDLIEEEGIAGTFTYEKK